jgi:hypothetical protein
MHENLKIKRNLEWDKFYDEDEGKLFKIKMPFLS